MEVVVPLLPEGTSNATVLAVNFNSGDSVVSEQTLVEIETDKVILEIPSPGFGTVSDVLVKVGDTVEAEQVLMVLADIEIPDSPIEPLITEDMTEVVSELSSAADQKSGGLTTALLGILIVAFVLLLAGIYGL